MVNVLFIIAITLFFIDLCLYAVNKFLEELRKKNSNKLLLDNDLKSRLLKKISELNNELKNFEKTHVSKKEYNELVHKYNILLNQYRNLTNRNKFLRDRIKKIKDKFY